MIGGAINHHDLEEVFVKWIFLYSLEKKAFEKNLEPLKGRFWENLGVIERTKKGFLEKGYKEGPMPLVQKKKKINFFSFLFFCFF